jgi:uncharacterized protein with HEPN domain
MPRESKLYLQDIIESVGIIREYINGADKASFLNDALNQDAVLMRLGIISEAGGNVKSYLDHDSLMIVARAKKLSREYFNPDLEAVWNFVTNDLSPLKQRIIKILDAETSSA